MGNMVWLGLLSLLLLTRKANPRRTREVLPVSPQSTLTPSPPKKAPTIMPEMKDIALPQMPELTDEQISRFGKWRERLLGIKLHKGEKDEIRDWFYGTIDPEKLRIVQAIRPIIGQKKSDIAAFQPWWNTIVFDAEDGDRFHQVRHTASGQNTLIHEVMHVWQRKYLDRNVTLAAWKEHRRAQQDMNPYRFTLVPGKALVDYGIEQQAEIIGDLYSGKKHDDWKRAQQMCANWTELGKDQAVRLMEDLHDQLGLRGERP